MKVSDSAPILRATVWVLVIGCADDPPTREPTGSDGAVIVPAAPAAGPMRELCGGPGESCCRPPLPACATGATCQPVLDDAAGRCELDAAASDVTTLCRSDRDCPPEATCCISGALGTCVRLEGAECPVPDLTLVRSVLQQAGVRATVLDVNADACLPAAGCECLLENECVLAAGSRRVLQLDPVPLNIGGADLLLGNPESSPLYARDACSGRAFVDHYLRYELVDERGVITQRHDARLVPECSNASAAAGPLASGLGCAQQGLRHGLPNFAPDENIDSAERNAAFGHSDCPYLDITDVPAGRYEVRITINPERVFVESRYDNNTSSYPIDLPAFADPLAECSSNRVLFWSFPVECGWNALPARSCTPGARVELGCPDCTGAPAVRVCPGEAPCSALDEVPSGASIYDLCPELEFACPESGRFRLLVGPRFFASSALGESPTPLPFECDLRAQGAADAGAPF